MTLYLVVNALSEKGTPFEVEGIFSTEEKAVEACTKDTNCLYEMRLDEKIPEDAKPEDHYAYYPRLEPKPDRNVR
jgi:hypothetical protein